MKILVLTPTFLPVVGGAELVLWEVYRRLSARHSILLLTPELQETLIETYARDKEEYPVNFKVVRYKDRLTFMAIPGHRFTQGLIPPFSISAVFALKKVLESFKADVINVHYTMPTGLAGAIANTFWEVPTVLTLNGRDVPGPGVPFLWKYWHRFISRFCTNITYVSEYCRKVVFGSQGPGVVTWNGVDFGKISSKDPSFLRQSFNISANEKVLFALQRLSIEKRVDALIKSMEIVSQKVHHCHLIIGGTGPESERLRNLVKKIKLDRQIHFAGFIPDTELSDYFNLCDIFLFHSTYETFGIVLAQAMAHGKPIVSVLNTAIPSVVPHGKCGLLVPPDSPQEFAEATVRLLNNKELARKLGAQGRERARGLFDWDIISEKYEKVFLEAVDHYSGTVSEVDFGGLTR